MLTSHLRQVEVYSYDVEQGRCNTIEFTCVKAMTAWYEGCRRCSVAGAHY